MRNSAIGKPMETLALLSSQLIGLFAEKIALWQSLILLAAVVIFVQFTAMLIRKRRRAEAIHKIGKCLEKDRVIRIIISADGLGYVDPKAERFFSLPSRADERRIIKQISLAFSDYKAPVAMKISEFLDKGESFEIDFDPPHMGLVKVIGRISSSHALLSFCPAEDRLGDNYLSKAAVEEIAVPMWLRDEAGFVIWQNQAALQAAGLVEAAGGRPDQLAQSTLKSGEANSERRLSLVDGERSVFLVTEVPQDNGTLGYAIDITGELAAEEALKQHQLSHEGTLTHLAAGVAVYNSHQKLIFHNPALERLWRLDAQFLSSKPTHQAILGRLREVRRIPESSNFRRWCEKQLLRHRNLIEPDEEIQHLPDGTILHLTIRPLPHGGLIYIYEDVSDHIGLERRYNQAIKAHRETLNALQEGVAMFSPDGALQLANPAFSQLWKLDDEGGVGDSPRIADLSERGAALCEDITIWQKFRKIIVGGAQREPLMEEVLLRDGRSLSASLTPLPDGSTLLAFVDITDSVNNRRVLEARNEALESSDHFLAEFLQHMSYKLRTPLNSISGFATMLDSELVGELSTRQHEYLSGIIQASSDMLTIIKDIIDLTALRSGSFELNLRPVKLGQILQDAADMSVRQALDKSVRLKVICPKNLPSLEFDEARIRQILFNLLSNALQHCSSGDSIEIGARMQEETVEIWVEDTGPGISEDQQQEILLSSQQKLGLSLVKRLVEYHSGELHIESSTGKGTKIACHFPARMVEQLSWDTPQTVTRERAG